MYKIIYGAIPESELMTIEQAEHFKEMNKKREKISKEAKKTYGMSNLTKMRQTNHIL
jgi:hypothetical protein